MVITRTPFRISFFGGGTDYPDWYRENGGEVISTTINKYCYISSRYLPPFFDYKHRIRYTLREETQSIFEIKHPSVRECLRFLKINQGIEMVHTSDLPARSGIGSSSAFTVGFLNSLYSLLGEKKTKMQIALDAIHVEQNLIKENVGSQDQIATAVGGFNKINFAKNGEIHTQPITITQEKLDFLQDHLMLFFTGLSRNSSDVAKEQIKQIPKSKKELEIMQEMVEKGIDVLSGTRKELDNFGRLLDQSWKIKRSLTNMISNNKIDDIYETGIKAGALGGKLCGAGGGGFMLFFAKPENQPKIKEKLKNLLYVPFRFEQSGTQVIFNDNKNNFY